MSYLFMKNRSGWSRTLLSTIITCLIVVFAALPVGLRAKDGIDEETLDQRYQDLLNQVLQSQSERTAKKDFSDFHQLVNALHSSDTLEGLLLIRQNLELVKKSPRAPSLGEIQQYLYQHNDTGSAQKLADYWLQNHHSAASSRQHFFLAQYFEKRQDWIAVQKALMKIHASDLLKSEQHYLSLLIGNSLQHNKNHRKAIQHYKSVPSTSPYYASAKFNEGNAYLRQGWWTEAYDEYKKALQISKANGDESFYQRILVALGYAQLHHEFYVDARNTFRQVSLNQTLTNKALMGIGLSAAHKQDFAGALNAFHLLMSESVKDLSVDEAYLLKAAILVDQKDESAIDAFQAAVLFYEKRIEALTLTQHKIQEALGKNDLAFLKELDSNRLELFVKETYYPKYLQENYKGLTEMEPLVRSLNLTQAHKALLKQYQNFFLTKANESIEERKMILNGYLSQAKFGMATQYDNP